MYLRSIRGNVVRVLVVKHDLRSKQNETLGSYFVRLNPHFLEDVTVLEMVESGGDLVCVHGSFGAGK